jgi:hypothetical protein
MRGETPERWPVPFTLSGRPPVTGCSANPPAGFVPRRRPAAQLVFVCAHGGNAESAARASVAVRSGSSGDGRRKVTCGTRADVRQVPQGVFGLPEQVTVGLWPDLVVAGADRAGRTDVLRAHGANVTAGDLAQWLDAGKGRVAR